jgi:hypothetical protein
MEMKANINIVSPCNVFAANFANVHDTYVIIRVTKIYLAYSGWAAW